MTTARTLFEGRLPQDGFLHLEPNPELEVHALQGSLWVTIDGHPEDIEIDPGDRRRIDADRRVVVGTLGGGALLRVVTHAPPHWRDRLHGAWARWTDAVAA